MSTQRLFCPVRLSANTSLSLGSEQARYVGRVLRLRSGDALTVFDGSDGEYPANVVTITKQALELNVGKYSSRSTESPLRIRLLQGISRGERMDIVVQKATELGVHRISPVLTEFSVVKLEPERAAKRVAHWTKVAASACEQSGRNELPLIDTPGTLYDVLDDENSQDGLRLVLQPGAEQPLPSIVRPEGYVTVLIGPEGGLSDKEQERAKLFGFAAVSFGPRILRTETAALAAIACLQSMFGDLGELPQS
jgi:16S rRNA (uracil1498-N3)-methyltransferase